MRVEFSFFRDARCGSATVGQESTSRPVCAQDVASLSSLFVWLRGVTESAAPLIQLSRVLPHLATACLLDGNHTLQTKDKSPKSA